MSSFPYIFTFYSYKGGVGRSMALLNTAYALIARGRHVLVLDMDLEAPGVSGFLQRNGELLPQEQEDPKDILDFLGMIAESAILSAEADPDFSALPPLSQFVQSAVGEKNEVLAPTYGRLGRLDFIVADQERDYWQRLSQLDIASRNREQLLELSARMWRYLKAQRFPFLSVGLEKEPPVDTPYDYILVDSRTGVTETGGLCVGPLADRLVVVTGLNDQNVKGTLSFLQEAGIDPRARTKNDEPWDEADDPNPTEQARSSLGPKPTIIVASPVPAGEIDFKRQRLRGIAQLLGPIAASLSYHPHMAVMESIFVRDYPQEYLALEYGKLADQMMYRVRDLPVQLAQRSQEEWGANDRGGAVASALRLATHDASLGEALLKQLGNLLAPQTDGDCRAAFRLYATLAQEGGETEATALNTWGIAITRLARTKSGDEAEVLFRESFEKYERAVGIKPDYHEAFYNWGNALSGLAETKSGGEAEVLFRESFEKYERAVGIKPDEHEAFNNWGNAISGLARTKSGDEAEVLFRESFEKYARSVGIKPDKHEAFNNWASALGSYAHTKAGEEARSVLLESRERCLQANAIRAGSADYNLACAEAMLGNVEESVRLLREKLASDDPPSRRQIEEDRDFAEVSDHPLFKEFLAELDPE
jgi:MinD-like ATPase involved in chromosome partitioning or flagellar assembly